ncbi:hypothetical protein H2248_011629 [Termitomyces sp. 'cryptogamus']|nr:hypothetical protein H2248_011629 [Termitomyces sp. 'cryptogamus']
MSDQSCVRLIIPSSSNTAATSEMFLGLELPDETETCRLLRQDKGAGAGAVEDNYQVLLTDLILLKKSNPSLDEYDMQIFRARMSGQDVIVKYN